MANDVKEIWSYELSKKLVNAVLSSIELNIGPNKKYTTEMSIHFLAAFVGALVHMALSDRGSGEIKGKELEKYVIDNFAHVKHRVQEAVAAGFTGAMNEHSKEEIEYYCQVKVVPPVVNNKVC